MSWSKPKYGPRRQELNWINGTIAFHDSFCGCEEPILHLVNTALKNGGIFNFNTKTLKQICLSTDADTTKEDGDNGDQDTGPEGNLDFGDLERLFDEEDPFTDTSTG